MEVHTYASETKQSSGKPHLPLLDLSLSLLRSNLPPKSVASSKQRIRSLHSTDNIICKLHIEVQIHTEMPLKEGCRVVHVTVRAVFSVVFLCSSAQNEMVIVEVLC